MSTVETVNKISVQTSNGTAVSDTIAETSLGALVFPANFWQAEKVVEIEFQTHTTAQNSTDTLVVKGRFGATATALASRTAVFSTTAVDQAVDDVCVGRVKLVCREDPSGTSSMLATANVTDSDASGTLSPKSYAVLATDFDTTVETRFDLSAVWSVASSGNSVRCEILDAREM